MPTMNGSRDLGGGGQAGDMPIMRRNCWISGVEREPISVRAVDGPDGECPPAPQPRFPVWKPRYLDGGVFPLDQAAAWQ